LLHFGSNLLTISTAREIRRVGGAKRVLERETETSIPEDAFHQGDILKIEFFGVSHPTPDLGVVINADCDLAHRKTDGVISYLPIYRFRTYLESFWAAGHVDEVRRGVLDYIRRVCSLDEREDENLQRWVCSDSPLEIANKLGTRSQLKTKAIEQLREKLERLRLCVDLEQTPFDLFRSFCKSEPNPEQYARKCIVNAKRSLSDGHFFVSDIAGEPDVGFIIRMRRIYSIDANACFRSISDREIAGNITKSAAVRVCRLTAKYRYRVAQLSASYSACPTTLQAFSLTRSF
jgi:hypothetical protein